MTKKICLGSDAKMHVREKKEGENSKVIFKANLGVTVHTNDEKKFDIQYDKILEKLFTSYDIERKRKVYKSHDIARLLDNNKDRIRGFYIGFCRELLNQTDVNVAYYYTIINSKALNNNLVTIGGDYDSVTEDVCPLHFINMIDNYYPVISSWKHIHNYDLNDCIVYCDGMEDIYPSHSLSDITKKHNLKILFNGDRIKPIVSTADMLVKHIDVMLHHLRKKLDGESIKSVICYNEEVDKSRFETHLISNPDLQQIKPSSTRKMGLKHLDQYFQKPLIFVDGNTTTMKNTKAIIEDFPILDSVYNFAHENNGSVRFFNLTKDPAILSRSECYDYYLPLTQEADQRFELFKRGGVSIRRLEL